jgi:hypothetical protein
VRFDTEALDQIKECDGDTARADTTNDGRLNGSRITNSNRFRRQVSSDSSLNTSPKKKTEIIRVKQALDILEVYNARYRLRSGGKYSKDNYLN